MRPFLQFGGVEERLVAAEEKAADIRTSEEEMTRTETVRKGVSPGKRTEEELRPKKDEQDGKKNSTWFGGSGRATQK